MKNFLPLLSVLFCVLSLGFSIALYPRLPDVIPTHWNLRLEPDAFGEKFPSAFLLPLIQAITITVLITLPRVVSAQVAPPSVRPFFDFIVALLAAFLTFLHILLLLPSLGVNVPLDSALVSGLNLFFLVLGFPLAQIPQNPLAGVRTPWTLRSQRVWNDTHRMASRSMIATGLFGLGLLACGVDSLWALPPALVGVLWPILYSWIRYRTLQRRGELDVVSLNGTPTSHSG